MKYVELQGGKEISKYVVVNRNIVIERKYYNKFVNGKSDYPIYYQYNGCAVYIGYFWYSDEKLFDEDFNSLCESRLESYSEEFYSIFSLNEEPKYGYKQWTSMAYEFVSKINPDITLQMWENLKKVGDEYDIKKHEMDEKRKREQELESAKQLKEFEDGLIDKLKSGKFLTGEQMLYLINYYGIDCPIRTKGLINKIYGIDEKYVYPGNKFKRKPNVDNVFAFYYILREKVL